MDRVLFWTAFLGFFLLFSVARSETEEVKQALVKFMNEISPANISRGENWGWNLTSDPCMWQGVTCDPMFTSVRTIVLDELNLNGVLDANSLCVAKALAVLSLRGNEIGGNLLEEISNCKHLTHLFLSGNNFSGSFPFSFSQLSNLKRLDVSNNAFSGDLPDLSRIPGLISFLAQNNQLTGGIPQLNNFNLQGFNISYNNFSGPIPIVYARFDASSFLGNPGLCGKPLPNAC